MTESPDTGKRYGSALASVFGTLPRRLLVIAGFAVLGWIGLALLGTSNAGAAPDHSTSGNAPSAAVPLLGPSLDDVTRPVGSIAEPVVAAAKPVTDLARPVTTTAASLTDQVAPATKPLTRALTPVTSALPKPSADPLTNGSSGLLRNLTRSADELTGSAPLDPSRLLPMLDRLLGGGAAPAPAPVPVGSVLVKVAPVHVRGGHDFAQLTRTTSFSTSRPADESLPATTGSASAPHGPLAGLGVPPPLPAVPPARPDSVLVAGSGSTATTSSGSGGSSTAGCNDEPANLPDLRPVGTADSARTRPVRNSATEPPVSPD